MTYLFECNDITLLVFDMCFEKNVLIWACFLDIGENMRNAMSLSDFNDITFLGGFEKVGFMDSWDSCASLGYVFGMFWVCFGCVLVMFCLYFGYVLLCFGYVLVMFWVCFG